MFYQLEDCSHQRAGLSANGRKKGCLRWQGCGWHRGAVSLKSGMGSRVGSAFNNCCPGSPQLGSRAGVVSCNPKNLGYWVSRLPNDTH